MLEEEGEVAGVDSHLLVGNLARGEVAASTALHVGTRDIIEPYGGLKELAVSKEYQSSDSLGHFHSAAMAMAIRCAAVERCNSLPYAGGVLEFVKHEITDVQRVLRLLQCHFCLPVASYKV